MDNFELKKQVNEIMKRASEGSTVRLRVKLGDRVTTVDVNGSGEVRSSKNSSAALSDPVFSLDLDKADSLTDEEIVEKISDASAKTDLAAAEDPLPQVVLTRDEARGVWVLFADCSYRPDLLDPTRKITAIKGFETDLASIPRVFWSIMAPEELSLAAPLFHDLLYRRGGTLEAGELDPAGYSFTRIEVDDLFRELMKKAGIPKWKRRTAYIAVRAFSSFAWKG